MKLVDTLDDSVLEGLGAWPTRFFIMRNGRLVFKAQLVSKSERHFETLELRKWLEMNL